MAHQNVYQVKKILRFENIIFKNQKFCSKDCILGKVYRIPFPKSDIKSEHIQNSSNFSGLMQKNSEEIWKNSIFLNDKR